MAECLVHIAIKDTALSRGDGAAHQGERIDREEWVEAVSGDRVTREEALRLQLFVSELVLDTSEAFSR